MKIITVTVRDKTSGAGASEIGTVRAPIMPRRCQRWIAL